MTNSSRPLKTVLDEKREALQYLESEGRGEGLLATQLRRELADAGDKQQMVKLYGMLGRRQAQQQDQ